MFKNHLTGSRSNQISSSITVILTGTSDLVLLKPTLPVVYIYISFQFPNTLLNFKYPNFTPNICNTSDESEVLIAMLSQI